MADSYSDRLGLIKMEEGAHSNDWGDLANLNFDRLDSAIRGYKKITLAGAETLDSNDITSTSSVAQEESFFAFIEFVGTAGTVTVPAEDMVWIVKNSTGSDFTFQPSGGTGVTIPNGDTRIVVYGSNGASFTDMTSSLQLKGDEIKTLYEGEADTNAFTDADHTKLDGIEAGADVTDTTNVTAAGALMTTGGTMTGNINLGDNDKAIFGAGSDLQIYHDGSNSYIQDQGTGKLILAGTDLALTDADGYAYIECSDTGVGGGVAIKHAAVTKLATTSTGIDVTGTVVADEVKVEAVDGLSIMSGTAVEASWTHTAGTGASVINVGRNTSWGGDLMIQTDLKNRAHFESNGDISFYEDTGTTAKFFWDASAESLGIGTSSPEASAKLDVAGNLLVDAYSNGGEGYGLFFRKGFISTAQPSITLKDHNGSSPDGLSINAYDGISFRTVDTERMRIDSSGNVGIGTSSPADLLHVKSSTQAVGDYQIIAEGVTGGYGAGISFQSPLTGGSLAEMARITADGEDSWNTTASTQDAGLRFYTSLDGSVAERMRIDSSGNVGIGTSSPSASYKLHVAGSIIVDSSSILNLNGTSTAADPQLLLGQGGVGIFRPASDVIGFSTNDTERMRIDSSGNLLVGTTSSGVAGSSSNSGIQLGGDSSINAAKNNVVAYLNRQSSDGDIVQFRKDGTTVGSIGTDEGTLYIGRNDTGVIFEGFAADTLVPYNPSTNNIRDNAISLGYGTSRFKDLYLSGNVYSGCTYLDTNNIGVGIGATGTIVVRRDNGPCGSFNRTGTDGAVFRILNDNSEVGTISVSGATTSYNTSSDYRLKEDDVPMVNSIDRLMQLRPINFAWKADGSRVDGFFAHEAGEVVPECATGTKDAMKEETYVVTPALGEVFIPAVDEVTEERQVTETVETGSYVNLAGETIVETTEQPVTTESTETVVERQVGEDGIVREVEVTNTVQVPVMETVVVTEAVAEQIISSNVEKPEELLEGQQWRETTPEVTDVRMVPDYQGIDQAKLVPLLVAAVQELTAKVEALEAAAA